MDKKDEVAKEKDKDKEPEVEPEDSDAGDKPEKDKEPGKPNPDAERLDRIERQVDRIERGGSAEAGMKPPEPKKETDDEYSKRVMSGEASPLEEDGFI